MATDTSQRILSRPVFQDRTPRAPGKPLPWEYIKPPEERAHAVPVAYAGNDIDGNLASHYCLGRGIKGAFWANFLSATHVAMADGEEELREEPEGDARRSVESWRPPRGSGQHSLARRQCRNLGSLRESCTPRFNPHFCHAKRPRRTNAACWVTFIENGRTTEGPMDRRNAFLCKPYSLVRSKKGCSLVLGGPKTLHEVTGTQRAARGCPLVEEAPLARTSTEAGSVGASVTVTRRSPLAHRSRQVPRSAFSTTIAPSGPQLPPAWVTSCSIAAWRRNLGFVTKKIHRGDTVSEIGVPAGDQPCNLRLSLEQHWCRLHFPGDEAPRIRQCLNRLVDHAAPACVHQIAQCHDANPVIRKPRASAIRIPATHHCAPLRTQIDMSALSCSPYPYPPPLMVTVLLFASRTAEAPVKRTVCCISRRDARFRGRPSGPSRGGHASSMNATHLDRSLTDVSMPPMEPNAPCGSGGSSSHQSSCHR